MGGFGSSTSEGGKRREYMVGFAVSSASPALAAVATNPIEVVKVRQQAGGAESANARRGIVSSLVHIGRSEGVAGLQAGLALAVVREASKAFFRIGCFQPILDAMHEPGSGPAPVAKRMASGMSSGAIAALVCNPIELVKTRQQSAGHMPGGHALARLRQIYRTDGLRGLWRGTGVSMARSAAVTGPHLTTYTLTKEHVLRLGWMADSTPLHVLSSLMGSFAGIACNHPFDTIRNRLYTRPDEYTSALGSAAAIWRSEGPSGFYRGFSAHYLRVGPHYVLTFVILEQLRKLAR